LFSIIQILDQPVPLLISFFLFSRCMTLQWTLTISEDDRRIMFVFYKEISQTLKCSPIRKNRKTTSLLSSASLTTSAAQHCRCYCQSSSPPYSVLIFSAVDILFRLIEGFVGQVEVVQNNCFRKIMSTRQSNQENSSIFDSNRSRRQQPTPSNIPSNQQQEPLNSSPSHSDQASKACCFCWCCCCSCSWYIY
jgi:hypothetical protein